MAFLNPHHDFVYFLYQSKKWQIFIQAMEKEEEEEVSFTNLGQLTSISSLILWSELICSRPCNQGLQEINNIIADKIATLNDINIIKTKSYCFSQFIEMYSKQQVEKFAITAFDGWSISLTVASISLSRSSWYRLCCSKRVSIIWKA